MSMNGQAFYYWVKNMPFCFSQKLSVFMVMFVKVAAKELKAENQKVGKLVLCHSVSIDRPQRKTALFKTTSKTFVLPTKKLSHFCLILCVRCQRIVVCCS